MNFRTRLALFLVLTLAAVQAITALLVYGVTRRELVGEGGRQLAVAAGTFARQLAGVSERVAENVQVLVLDYALRAAIAQHDGDTTLSALRNHGRRVGASRMLLLDLDGKVQADTGEPNLLGAAFPYRGVLAQALERPSAALAAIGGKVYCIVVVPVFAPNLIGLIAAEIPVDDALLGRLQEQSALPRDLELVTGAVASAWQVAARGGGNAALAAQVASPSPDPQVIEAGGREFVALARPLEVAAESPPVAAVLGYSLDDALRPYRSVGVAWAALLALGLAAAVVGAMLIARGVSRPLEALARSARRIASGDYAEVPAVAGGGEVGELGAALGGMAHAIAEREERIRHQADHDAITGLPNRVAAEAVIGRELAEPGARGGALLMVSLPRLPEIVKTMGHGFADRLMRDAAARLDGPVQGGRLARATDTEFSVWLPGADRNAAIAAALRVQAALGDSYREAEVEIDTAPVVGIALAPLHGDQASTLLQRAEVALFGALGSHDALAVYDPATDPHRPERLSLMADLRAALERGQLSLHYQPKLNLATGEIDGAEGLVRWTHPKRGAIPPDAFIGLAEETGNISRLTRWALGAAMAQLDAWKDKGYSLKVAVNVSAKDLDDSELPLRVSQALSAYAVPADRLVVEITESSVMGKPEAAVQVLRRLADLGVHLAIDDFGTGQSSFAYLHRLPVRELKIDKAFIKQLARNLDDQAIVRSMVELGHRLGYRVTAEGVEDASALEFLAKIGCDHAQGFHLSKALPAEAFERYLAERPPPPPRANRGAA